MITAPVRFVQFQVVLLKRDEMRTDVDIWGLDTEGRLWRWHFGDGWGMIGMPERLEAP